MCLLANLKDLLSTVWLAHRALANLSDWIMAPVVASASWGCPPPPSPTRAPGGRKQFYFPFPIFLLTHFLLLERP